MLCILLILYTVFLQLSDSKENIIEKMINNRKYIYSFYWKNPFLSGFAQFKLCYSRSTGFISKNRLNDLCSK